MGSEKAGTTDGTHKLLMSHGIKIFFLPASTTFSLSTFPWMLLGKTVAYNSLLHDNTVNYTRPHVLHMPYARSHPDAIAPSLSLPLFPFFLKNPVDECQSQLRHLIITAAPVLPGRHCSVTVISIYPCPEELHQWRNTRCVFTKMSLSTFSELSQHY